MITDLANIRHIYFLGLGGIGMSALARYFMSKGIAISGYDKTPSELTEKLTSEGATIHFTDDPELIPSDIDLAIYTPAIPNDLKEFQALKNSGLPLLKRAKVVGLITRGKTTIAVAGTHGKTSITSLISHMLKRAGFPVTGLIGGISRNYGTNFIASGKEEIMVVEADEYDRSFLELEPDIAVISSMDPDHLDIYGSAEAMNGSFMDFVSRVKQGGTVVIRYDLKLKLRKDLKRVDYAIIELSDSLAFNLRVENGLQMFDMLMFGKDYKDISIGIPGRHNVENAVAAAAVGYLVGLNKKQIIEGIQSFRGVKRRFDFRVRQATCVYIDDYAHHPKELEAFISAVRELYRDKKITGLFQPHLYTRTRDFAEGFARSLDLLDEAWLMDIYPARELPITGISSELILDKMHNPSKKLLNRQEVLQLLTGNKPEVFLTMGAGDIDLMVPVIEKTLMS